MPFVFVVHRAEGRNADNKNLIPTNYNSSGLELNISSTKSNQLLATAVVRKAENLIGKHC